MRDECLDGVPRRPSARQTWRARHSEEDVFTVNVPSVARPTPVIVWPVRTGSSSLRTMACQSSISSSFV